MYFTVIRFSSLLMPVPKRSFTCNFFYQSFIICCSWTEMPVPDADFCLDVAQGNCFIEQ
jgi:hypothetical protein